jgi:hypothetical protein
MECFTGAKHSSIPAETFISLNSITITITFKKYDICCQSFTVATVVTVEQLSE